MKKGLLLFLIVISLFIGKINVSAMEWNGGSGGAPGGSGGTCSTSWAKCAWNNAHFRAVKLTLIYYDGSNRETIADPYYIINNDYDFAIQTFENNGVRYDINSIITGGCSGTGCSLNSDFMKDYILTESHFELILSKMGTSIANLERESEEGIGYNKKGYRVLIEPLFTFLRYGNLGLFTLKELYADGQPTSNPPQDLEWGWTLHTDNDDIGIYSASARGKTGDPNVLRDPNSGYGYNIVNISEGGFLKKCYRIGTSGTMPVCRRTNQQNPGFLSEVYTQVPCSDGEQVENATKDGRLVKSINASCKLYCQESVELSFPGNISPAMTTGTYFVWPTMQNGYPGRRLQIKGTRNCVLKGNSCGGYRPTIEDVYSGFESSAKLKYNDKDYGRTFKLEQASKESSVTQTGDKITATWDVHLKIPDNIYRYVNKATGKSSDTKVGSGEFTDIGYGNLPISTKSALGTSYNLQITDMKIGVGNLFGSVINKQPYECTYSVTKDTTRSCVCPPGTPQAGKDLFPEIANNSPMTCIDAQSKFCDVPCTENCEVSRYCKDKPEISIEACLTSGNSYEYCNNKYCLSDKPPKYECPKNNTEGFTEFMDITGCVETLIAKGYTENQAMNICKDIVCPLEPNNRPGSIIYRTIDLDAPFPSKNLNGNISWGNNLGLNNGRYPGKNWNSKDVVKSQILNNRNVKGNALYSDKSNPIYVIDLSPDQIEKIKAYNSSHKYDDFKLTCNSDGSACTSSFLRDRTLVTGGACANVSKDNFYTCLNQ